MLSRWTVYAMTAIFAAGGLVAAQQAVESQASTEARRVEPVEASQPSSPVRAAAFAGLKAEAQQEGDVHVIVQVGVDRFDRLSHAAAEAETPAKGARADADLARAIKASVDRELAQLAGSAFQIKRRFQTVPFVALKVGAATLEKLEALPNVVGIQEDELSRPILNNTVDIVGASTAWADGWDGTGWAVAILDTGILASHEFFSGTNLTQACFALGEDGAPGAGDCANGQSVDTTSPDAAAPSSSQFAGYDHGTHVSGIAVGNGPSVPASGVAREADLIHVKIFSEFVGGCEFDCMLAWNSDRLAGLEHVYSLRSSHDIAAVSMSLGGSDVFDDPATCDAEDPATKAVVDNLRAAGIVTLAASGNGASCSGISAPACISSIVSVGATSDSDTEYGGNNFHSDLLDLFAPGVSVLSSVASGDTDYASFSGTSMAAPHAAGAWAILKQAFPDLGVQVVLNALADSGAGVDGSCGVPVPQRRIQIDAALAQLGLNACCQGGEVCTNESADGCDALDGKFRPGLFCSQIPDPCSEDVSFSQPPTPISEGVASNIDWSDQSPNTVTADDFTSDGRAIRAVRWWGGGDTEVAAVAAARQADPVTVSGEPGRARMKLFPSRGMNPGPVPANRLIDGAQAASGVAVALDPTDTGWGTEHFTNTVASLTLDNPSLLTLGGTHLDTLFTGAEFGDNGDCSFMYVLDAFGNTFGRLDIASGRYAAIGPAVPVGTEFWGGLALDPTDGTMYAVSAECDVSSTLYTVDLATGLPTPIGPVTNAPCIVGIAIDTAGQMYGMDLSDNLVAIDKSSGAGTIVGPVGFDANFSQGMDFDERTGTLYLAAMVDGASTRAELRTCDTATGATTFIGNIGNPPGNAELGGFGIPNECIDRDPDGWFISFHEPYANDPAASTPPLGLYFCDAAIVETEAEPRITCDAGFSRQYRARLDECCLVHATADSRTSTMPAEADGFYEERCADYALDIQAVIGHRFESDGGGGCTEVSTGRSLEGNFWVWQTTDAGTGAAHGLTAAATTGVTMSGPDWLYGPWSSAVTTCGSPNMAFELITDQILDGETDANDDGYPDSCSCETAASGAAPDPGGIPQNRYLAISVDEPIAAGTKQAIQITLVDVPGFSAFNGETRWVGPHGEYPDEDSSRPGLTFTAAGLSCEPHFVDWSTIDLLQVFGGEIVPEGTYEVRIVEDCCDDLGDPSCYSNPTVVEGGVFGDMVSQFAFEPGAPVQPDFNDISGAVSKFLAAPEAPKKALAQTVPNYIFPDRAIDFKGIAAVVNAFLAQPYASQAGIFGPCACPSAVTCGATACAGDASCGTGFCIGGFCRDECGRCSP